MRLFAITFLLSSAVIPAFAGEPDCPKPGHIELQAASSCPSQSPPIQMVKVWRDGAWREEPDPTSMIVTYAIACAKSVCVWRAGDSGAVTIEARSVTPVDPHAIQFDAPVHSWYNPSTIVPGGDPTLSISPVVDVAGADDNTASTLIFETTDHHIYKGKMTPKGLIAPLPDCWPCPKKTSR